MQKKRGEKLLKEHVGGGEVVNTSENGGRVLKGVNPLFSFPQGMKVSRRYS